MQSSPDQLPPHFLLIMPALSVGFFCFMSYLSSVISGWHKLSQRFFTQSEPYGATRSAGPFFCAVYMRYWTHYSWAIHMTAGDDALYLSVYFLLRVGHPPLRIPWSEITIARTKNVWQQFILLTLGEQERIPMRISERMAEKLGILDRVAN